PAADTTTSATRSARPIRAYMSSGQPPRVVFDPVPGPSHQVVRTVGSTDSIAESMIKEFKYDPNDRTPPKRRMKVVAEVVKSAVHGSDPPVTNAHTSTLERQ
nr:hypothetical protein [Tanacetum cinerariifolium]